jgi:hypothetical protein
VTGVVVIGGCVVIFSNALALFFRLWDPCSLFAIVVFGTISSVVGIWQYSATFWGSERAARKTAAALAVLGLFMLGVGAIANAEIAWSTNLNWRFLPAMPELFIAGLLVLLAATINGRWAERLQLERRTWTTSHSRWRISLFDAIAAMTVIAGVCACTAAVVRQIHPRWAEHVPASAVSHHLPAGAEDVSYCQGFRGTFACEFRCSEQAFREWVEGGIGSIESQAANIKIEEINSLVSVRRFTMLQSDATSPETATVTMGLEYSWSKEDRSVQAVFDRTQQRGYLFKNFH